MMLGFWGAVLLWMTAARADESVDLARNAALEQARMEIADQVQLAAFDLIDEMVYRWSQQPPFATATPVVVASVSVPVGLGTGMQALVENHLSTVVQHHPSTNVQLVHCPSCTAVLVHSGPEGTVLSRGIDNPALLDELTGTTDRHALFVDIEAEGSWLVLRARMTRLTPDLPIVWSQTIAAASSTPALLRQSDRLVSAAEARQEYLDVLQDKGPVQVPLRFSIRSYPQSGRGFSPPPFLWLQTGVELGTTDARRWTSSVLAGYSFIPQAYQGILIQSRIHRLITGQARSLTRPNLYGFVGAAAISVWGPAAASFREERLTSDELLTDNAGDDPRNTFGALHTGLDLRIGNRIGMSVFLESMPALNNAANIGTYVYIGTFEFKSFGTEVTFCF